MASKFWVDNIKNHLDLLNQCCSRLPAGERLEVQDLNEILDLFEQSRQIFLLQCAFQGFELEKT